MVHARLRAHRVHEVGTGACNYTHGHNKKIQSIKDRVVALEFILLFHSAKQWSFTENNEGGVNQNYDYS